MRRVGTAGDRILHLLDIAVIGRDDQQASASLFDSFAHPSQTNVHGFDGFYCRLQSLRYDQPCPDWHN